ncbi:MAG: hypothetical protein WD850_01395 [Candidatus Spechtbacterales bacterium]
MAKYIWASLLLLVFTPHPILAQGADNSWEETTVLEKVEFFFLVFLFVPVGLALVVYTPMFYYFRKRVKSSVLVYALSFLAPFGAFLLIWLTGLFLVMRFSLPDFLLF